MRIYLFTMILAGALLLSPYIAQNAASQGPPPGKGPPGGVFEDAIITVINDLSWPTLQRPPSGSHTYTVSASGGADSGTGNRLYGSSSRGEYTLTKTGFAGGFNNVTIDIQNINSGNGSVSLSNFKGVYGGMVINSFPAANLPKPASSGTPLYLGATAQYTSSVPEGIQIHPTFDIVVTYTK